MKQASTLFLKITLIVVGGSTLAFCIFAIPSISKGVGTEWPDLAYLKYPILIGGYLTAIPFFIALYQAFKLLTYIDKNTAFSEASVKALKYIKYCGIAMSVLYLAGMPILIQIADADDAPGAVGFGMLFAVAPLVVSVFAAVLQKLLQNAIDIKSENDLIV
ncbi:MAG: hypothetical protein A3J07_02325 [Candidatus Doudnabacteria bacterium RIFCSPLOWO2_02_FULL_49_13]|uniref:DUF2975 domain-containing protein n=1 Tax=Candidatus Doudnabacteria bacterium RIFCSPHIGHO2_12_FULL_48_16 TaxID=1817838 RepID=A0A1F5PLM0_9BACT|nr:MAG: hypothetical protein A3B77_00390 [Candidatus Doudnabacteria bacterium RIFCSPHIGHO2_02_FULL_49_24]OGE89497.1 MAG: hypothetical protein A2760_02605 [Candidatus Doudnabacteria bacterium RIFCSPHIGHO2_01_FULL_50_67]OGE90767.1 MAG: hypothetical protein A3E29_01425 [Candidatus Doudnabacteria bacterium RIFCSPHIGHO2_12_FULL_48_16]OGE97399.1 MAG: hypothetical protein A2990_01240 [Candidatus Doudnabacteria bacterium RIFCSPLOWO2_01_FULL_49_40]OGF02629.1 MAG: hypothetical protein A3J07_02325 [Candid